VKWIFWVSALALIYTFAGYPLLLALRSRLKPRPVKKECIQPSLSILIAVHNEAALISRKLENLFSLSWPAENFEVIVVSDGSTDGTNDILQVHRIKNPQLKVLETDRRGKSAALNLACKKAIGEILILSDIRQLLEPEAIAQMVANFSDPDVGGVSGALMLGTVQNSAEVTGEGLKWGIENSIREWEGATGSVVGALGAFYAIRRTLFTQIPEGLLLDDMWVPLHVVKQKRRVVFEKAARAWDDVRPTRKQEFRRKVRTLTGNYQLLRAAPWLITPQNSLLFEFVSHKLMRLVAPLCLLMLLVSSSLLSGLPYRIALFAQLLLYALAALTLIPVRTAILGRLADVAHTFIMLNAAAVLAFVNFLTGKNDVWVRQ
jgi:biofilm PGA synthesis N-glycosyltransferase PgaC